MDGKAKTPVRRRLLNGNGKAPPPPVQAIHEEPRLDLGHRLKSAALEAGLTARDLAAAMGKKSDSTIRLWWREETSPSPRDLLVYARLVGKPPEYFLGRPSVTERVMEVLAGLMAGQSVAEALEEVGGEPPDVSPQARALMEGGGREVRAALTRRTAGRWHELSQTERLAIVDELMADGDGRQDGAGPAASRLRR